MAPDTRSAERLQQLRKRIEQWRLIRRKHGPMPGTLWDEAASLARSLGVSPVSRALGVGYASLQQRVRGGSESRSASAEAPASASGFVEFHRTQLLGAPTADSSACGALVEVVASDGARLTIRLPASSALDVAGLVATFRGSRP
jgi:hypothetical protein